MLQEIHPLNLMFPKIGSYLAQPNPMDTHYYDFLGN